MSKRPLILLVDDDPIMRFLATEALEGASFDVCDAESGERGLVELRERRPDLVLLDVVMPDVDGYETCRALRREAAGASVPIVMITGLDDFESIDRAYDAGATDFVTKPINYRLLAHRLRYLLRASDAVRQARASNRRLLRAQKLARLAQWELDTSTRDFRWSDEAAETLGVRFEAKESGLEVLLGMVHSDDRARVQDVFERCAAHQLEYRLCLADGTTRVVRQDAEVFEDVESGTTLLAGATQDVTDLRNAERRVLDLAYFDPLTGLPNRTFLNDFLQYALARADHHGHMLGVLSLDLDGFKRVNDTLGHAAGDALLREVARRLNACVRIADALDASVDPASRPNPQHTRENVAARLGGDEFVVVLSRMSSIDDAAVVARRIADGLSGMYTILGTEVFISVSIGVACYPHAGVGVSVLLERADAAMYHAKQSGRNQFQFFTADLQDKAKRRLALETSLRSALASAGIHPPRAGEPATTSELFLVYQPKVQSSTLEVTGVEALLRWTSPQHGPVSPVEFIPIAEETGLIVPLGEWVLRTACAQAKEWARVPEERMRVAVNVSARQFREPNLPRMVASVLASTQLSPELLELEITEGLLIQDTQASGKALDDLKALGVRIALDDFGTGYSSLSYLTRLPIDALKIDRSFMKEMGDARSETITAAIIGLSRGLDIEVVVEGVETKAQLDFLRAHGDAEIQGYYFARPMTVEALAEWRKARATKHPSASQTPPRARYAA